MPNNGRKHAKPVPVTTQSTASTAISKDVQQQCLNVFRTALWESIDDLKTVQEVKGHLYNRDFSQAFSRADYLRAYALRWSASRALGYAAIFDDIKQYLHAVEGLCLHALCLGGGAGAEVVGLAGWCAARLLSNPVPDDERTALNIVIHAVDVADWADVIGKLQNGIVEPPQLSQYASAAAKAKNKALLSGKSFRSSFSLVDVLQWDLTQVNSAVSGVSLITIMFTLNELYASSVPKTQHLLGMVTEAADNEALLLVVDSPGSYSTVSINGAQKRYPMQWLLDVTLLGHDKDDDKSSWTKVVSENSKWFRLPEGIDYPVELENMRYQIHLYRRRRVHQGA